MALKDYFKIQLPQHRLPQLDGLRAVAVMVVFWGHAVHVYNIDGQTSILPIGPFDLAYWVFGVSFGADLFLMLSGLLIMASLLRHWRPEGGNAPTLKAYAANRFWRIFPPYALMVGLTALGIFYTPQSQDLFKSVVEHLFFMQDYGENDLNISYWAMALEVKFYLAAPLLIFVLHKLNLWRWRYIVMGVLLITPVTLRYLTPLSIDDYFIIKSTPHPMGTFAFLSVFRVPFHLYFDAFAAGALLAMLWHDREKLKFLWQSRLPQLAFWAGIIGLMVAAGRPPALTSYFIDAAGNGRFINTYHPVFLQFSYAIFVMLIYMGVLAGYGPQRFLCSKPLRYLAQVSFSFYLVHWGALQVWADMQMFIYKNWLGLNIDPMAHLPFIMGKVIGGLVLTLIFTFILYYVAERPTTLIKRAK